MRFSIVVPVLNEEELLEKSLQSIKNQNYKDYEIIVVDNGSTDKSVEIAKKYADKILFESKRGSSMYPMKKGFDEAKGDIFLSCDADTIYPSDHLKKINDIYSNDDNIVLVYGSFSFIEENHKKRKITKFFYNIASYFSRLFGVYLTGAANMSFIGDAYREVGGYDIKTNLASPDLRLAKKMSRLGKVKYDPHLTVMTSNRRFSNNSFLKKIKTSFKVFVVWVDIAFNINKIENDFYFDKDYYEKK